MLTAMMLVAVAIALVNPFHFWMPSVAHMLMLGLTVVVFGVFSIFVFSENGGDEREETHKMFTGRAAFLAGGAVLLCGIVVQSFADTLDPWLVGALVVMVMAKVCVRYYYARYR